MKINEYTVFDLGTRIQIDNIAPQSIYNTFIERINAADNRYFSAVFDYTEEAVNDNSVLLYGVPFAVSDNICIKSETLHYGSSSYAYTPMYDAECVSQLKHCGAIPIGYTKMSEFNLSAPTNYAVDVVADKLLPFALTTDMTGCIMVDACKKGICAIKPTFSICSRFGILYTAPTIEQLCLLANDSRDLFIIIEHLLKNIRLDTTAYNSTMTISFAGRTTTSLNPLTIGVYTDTDADKQCNNAIWRASELFELFGATIQDKPLSLPVNNDLLLEALTYYECNIEQLLGCDIAGSNILSTKQYNSALCSLNELSRNTVALHRKICRPENNQLIQNAQKMRAKLIQAFDLLLTNIDVVICPIPAEYKPGSKFANLLSAIMLSDLCCMTIPIETDSNDKPICMLIFARQFSEGTLLSIAGTFEQTHRFVKSSKRGKKI